MRENSPGRSPAVACSTAHLLRIEIGHLAQYDTRHTDVPHARHRPDGERLSRREAAQARKAVTPLVLMRKPFDGVPSGSVEGLVS